MIQELKGLKSYYKVKEWYKEPKVIKNLKLLQEI
jgi:hypothetical protein